MSKSRKKGTTFERTIANYIALWIPGTDRAAPHGSKDVGDIYIPGENRFIIEAKCHRDMRLSEWVDEAAVEAANAGVHVGVVVHKRTRRPVHDQYVTMTLENFMRLMVR
ncbi:MAG: hypothetical protein IRZ06_12665 [Nevskia sp.]|nr:hypothetical protein [Nevskia sp.]